MKTSHFDIPVNSRAGVSIFGWRQHYSRPRRRRITSCGGRNPKFNRRGVSKFSNLFPCCCRVVSLLAESGSSARVTCVKCKLFHFEHSSADLKKGHLTKKPTKQQLPKTSRNTRQIIQRNENGSNMEILSILPIFHKTLVGLVPFAYTTILTENAEKAQQLCSQLCYKLKTERDIAINCKIMLD